MLDHQHRHAGVADRADQRHRADDLRGVQPAHDFVEAEHARLCGEGARDLEPLQLPDGQRAGERVRLGGERRPLEDVAHAPLRLRAAPPPRAEVRRDGDVLRDGHGPERPDDLVRPHDAALDDGGIREAIDALAAKADLARRRRQRADEAGEERRLPRAVRADDPEDVALGDVEVDGGERQQSAEALREMADGEQRVSGHAATVQSVAPRRRAPAARRA